MITLKKRLKMLFFGAGVLGSLYAARMQEAGMDVTLVARGDRLRDLREHGIVLEDFDTGVRTATRVRVAGEMPTDEFFDVCVVLVRKNQLAEALPTLAENERIPAYLFMVNSAEGQDAEISTLGRDRVLLGHANAGGERDGHVVRYMVAQEITMGELDGEVTPRIRAIAEAFRAANLPVVFSRNMDAWKRYHVALAVPFCLALYREGSCNYRLADSQEGVRDCIRGLREAFAAMRALRFPVEPPKLRWLLAIPDFLLVPLFRRVLRMKIADIGLARHARNARDEMEALGEELYALIAESGLPTPTIEKMRKDLQESDDLAPAL